MSNAGKGRSGNSKSTVSLPIKPVPLKKSRKRIRKSDSRVCSWTGLEELRHLLTEAAAEVRASDVALRQGMPDIEATGRIMMGLRDQSTATTPELKRAVDAQNSLHDRVDSLVNDHGMDFYFVRSEWARIVDPSDSNVKKCDAMCAAALLRNHCN